MPSTRPNMGTFRLPALVLSAFFMAQYFDGKDAARVDALAATDAQHAAADVAQQAKVERAMQIAEVGR